MASFPWPWHDPLRSSFFRQARSARASKGWLGVGPYQPLLSPDCGKPRLRLRERRFDKDRTERTEENNWSAFVWIAGERTTLPKEFLLSRYLWPLLWPFSLSLSFSITEQQTSDNHFHPASLSSTFRLLCSHETVSRICRLGRAGLTRLHSNYVIQINRRSLLCLYMCVLARQ